MMYDLSAFLFAVSFTYNWLLSLYMHWLSRKFLMEIGRPALGFEVIILLRFSNSGVKPVVANMRSAFE